VTFNWHSESLDALQKRITEWIGERHLECNEVGLWSGRWSTADIVRGARLLRHWHVLGLQAQAWDTAVERFCICVDDNPYTYNPERARGGLSVTEWLELADSENASRKGSAPESERNCYNCKRRVDKSCGDAACISHDRWEPE